MLYSYTLQFPQVDKTDKRGVDRGDLTWGPVSRRFYKLITQNLAKMQVAFNWKSITRLAHNVAYTAQLRYHNIYKCISS